MTAVLWRWRTDVATADPMTCDLVLIAQRSSLGIDGGAERYLHPVMAG